MDNIYNVKLAAKKIAVSTALAASILSAAGCSTKPVGNNSKIESMDNNLDDSKNYSDQQIKDIIDAAYSMGYSQGSINVSMENQALESINELAQKNHQVYVEISRECSNNQELINFAPVDSLVCISENRNNMYFYYVIECNEGKDISDIVASTGKTNWLDGRYIDHDFESNNIQIVPLRDYVNQLCQSDCFGYYDVLLEKGEKVAFPKFDSSVFNNQYIYDGLSNAKKL